MQSKKIRFLTMTAVLLALTVAFQLLNKTALGATPASPYIIGTLVNLCLILAAVVVGVWSGATIAVLSPVLAFAFGIMKTPLMLPWTMAGNLALVLLYGLLAKNAAGDRGTQWVRWCAVGVGAAILKFAIIWVGQAVTLTVLKGAGFSAALGVALPLQLQQLITALVAMPVAKLVIAALPRSVKE